MDNSKRVETPMSGEQLDAAAQALEAAANELRQEGMGLAAAVVSSRAVAFRVLAEHAPISLDKAGNNGGQGEGLSADQILLMCSQIFDYGKDEGYHCESVESGKMESTWEKAALVVVKLQAALAASPTAPVAWQEGLRAKDEEDCARIWKAENSWNLSRDDFISASYVRGCLDMDPEWRKSHPPAINGSDNKSSDVVYIAPDGIGRLTRFQVESWLSSWNGFHQGYMRACKELRSTAIEDSSDRMAYEGAREDLLDWKRRALAAEELNRKFIREINESNGPMFMGEPATSTMRVEPIGWVKPANRVVEESTTRQEFSRGKNKPPIGTWEPVYAAPVAGQDDRAEFEQWYAENAFDFVKNPIGSRDCGLQWKAWQAAKCRASRPSAESTGTAQAAGWKLVPIEPTPEMIEAPYAGMSEVQCVKTQEASRRGMTRAYKAMLAAAPHPASAESGGAGEDARDAARYRWLRKDREVLLLTGFFGNGCINRTIEEVDTHIDAAIAKAAVAERDGKKG